MPQILVVDDDPDLRDAICQNLQSAGYAVTCADNGWEALLALDRSGADLIIVDTIMPGMDGLTFLNIISNDIRRQVVPIIVISGFDDLPDVAGRLRYGNVHHFIRKGDRGFYEDLIRSVDQLLRAGVKKLN